MEIIFIVTWLGIIRLSLGSGILDLLFCILWVSALSCFACWTQCLLLKSAVLECFRLKCRIVTILALIICILFGFLFCLGMSLDLLTCIIICLGRGRGNFKKPRHPNYLNQFYNLVLKKVGGSPLALLNKSYST
jgi:hypothetical protein